MIGYVTGTVVHVDREANEAVVNTASGVGYVVRLHPAELANLAIDSAYQCFIHTQISETATNLWGFQTAEQLKLVKLLISVNGVGPSLASALVSGKGIPAIYEAIALNKPEALKGDGVGLKTAQKIILSLADKLEAIASLAHQTSSAAEPSFKNDARESLATLGFSLRDINSYLATNANKYENAEQLIKAFLQHQANGRD